MVQKTKHKNALFFLASFCFLFFNSAFINSCSSLISKYDKKIHVENVIDGDTFMSSNDKYRILGIDAPETFDIENNQITSGPQYFYGRISTLETKKVIESKSITIESLKKDKYDRWISKVTLENGEDLASYLVSNGMAIVRYISPIKNSIFYYYDSVYIDKLYNLQNEAKSKKIGFWSENESTFKKIFPK